MHATSFALSVSPLIGLPPLNVVSHQTMAQCKVMLMNLLRSFARDMGKVEGGCKQGPQWSRTEFYLCLTVIGEVFVYFEGGCSRGHLHTNLSRGFWRKPLQRCLTDLR